ncbi:T9SS type A sorting domain-containing protein [Flavobacterium sp.]|jgi:hypothetical protein|uniref:T9SS type A sorting domain-containing protein n=1 Tax=Flavobacterium sp. TaxID=239 RepID=UPI002A7EE9F8|nr:T9SS type A sorting domain-containing protein [Flavobacterium sp.]
MKKLLLTLALTAGFYTLCSAQMYVSPSSYVFVNDQFVYVTQDVNLDNTGNFYLRNKSQLLQGTAGAGANRGLGNLSVFQEGTVNNFQYNYWCSPVGVPAAAVGNANFGISRLNRPTTRTASTPATLIGGYDGVSSPLSISTRWIYTFTTSTTYAQWNAIAGASTIAPGSGFTMKGTSGTDAVVADATEGVANKVGSAQRYDFRGLPNDGTISSAVSAGNFTLVGNPYPSAIDINSFLLDGSNAALINGQAYFWEQVTVNSHYIAAYQGGYGIYNPVTSIYTPAAFFTYDGTGTQGVPAGAGTAYARRFSPVGQGFMVMGTAGGNVAMRNSFRTFVKEGGTSVFARTASNESEYYDAIPNVAGIDYTQVKKGTAPYLRINAMYNNGGVRPTTIAFLDTATDGFDYGADGRSPSNEAAEFYYILNDMPHEYVATAVKFDINKKIPVGLRCASQANFKVQVIGAFSGFDDAQKVYMHDKETGVYYDIKNGVFDMTMPAGDNKTRFEITFKNYADVLDSNDNALDSFQVFQNNDNAMLTVVNTLKKDVTSIDLYDVTGKIVVSKVNLGKSEQYEISTSGLSAGIYIVKLTTRDNLSIDKKVSIYRK